MAFYSQPGEGRHFALSVGYARGPETRIYVDSLDDTPSIDALVEMLNALPLLRIATALETIAHPQPDRLVIAARMMAAFCSAEWTEKHRYTVMADMALEAADALLSAAREEGK